MNAKLTEIFIVMAFFNSEWIQSTQSLIMMIALCRCMMEKRMKDFYNNRYATHYFLAFVYFFSAENLSLKLPHAKSCESSGVKYF